jgi:hypothetical protein
MLPLHLRIDRTRRFLRTLENDKRFLDARVAPLTADRQRHAKSYAAKLMEQTRAEIARMLQEIAAQDTNDSIPQAAD